MLNANERPCGKSRRVSKNLMKKQVFPEDTKNSCPELFQDNRECQVKADIIIRRGEVNQETKVNRALRNGGCQPSIEFWMSDVRGISFAVNYVHPAILKTLTIIKKEKEVKYQRSEYEGRWRKVKEGKL